MESVYLSEREKEYLKDPEKFEDEHGLDYARRCRHRIREKMNKALDTLLFVLEEGKARESAKREHFSREKGKEDGVWLEKNLPQRRREKVLVDFLKVKEIVKKISRRGRIEAEMLMKIAEEAYEEQR